MSKLFCVILSFLFACNISAQAPKSDPHWILSWEDDFDTFNHDKWLKMNYGRHGLEKQLYMADNVWTENGNLIIELNNTPTLCPSPAPNPTSWSCNKCISGIYNYTSGWVETKKNFNSHFGYIEARIKLPYGYWPAFWTWRGVNYSSQNEAEIDIFEILGITSPKNTVTTNFHVDYHDTINDFAVQTLKNYDYTNWHTYAVEWSPSKIIWYIDDIPTRLATNHGIIDSVRIILNLAIHHSYTPPTYPTIQEYMYVDYVKVYHLDYTESNTNLNVTNTNQLNNYNNTVKKNINIGNSVNTVISLPNDSLTLRATDAIIINNNFEVPLGKSFYLDVNPKN